MTYPRPVETLWENDSVSQDLADEKFARDVQAHLIQLGVFKPIQGQARYRIDFVGLVVAGDRTFQVMPKTASRDPADTRVTMREVVRALRRYGAARPVHHEAAPHLRPIAGQPELSAIALADWLISDYLVHGVYRRLIERQRINGSGPIDWRRTIDGQLAFLAQGRPVYLDTVTRSTAGDAAHFVSRLHRLFVEQAIETYGHLLGYAPISLDQEVVEPLLNVPGEDFSRVMLGQEMRQVFSDRAMMLIPMLLAWLASSGMRSQPKLALYGLTTFYRVWESACALAIGNEVEDWKAFIPKPVWTNSEGQSQAADTFLPDIVRALPAAGGGEDLLIADAKYYGLAMPPQLAHQPGVNDVAKQYWYEQCLAEPARARGYRRVFNIFVMPGSARAEGFWHDGQVAMAGMGSAAIAITRIAFLETLTRYSDRRPLSSSAVCATADSFASTALMAPQ